MNLRIRDLDFHKNLIHIIRKGAKRYGRVIPQMKEDLRRYLLIQKEVYPASDDDNSCVFE